MDRKEVIERLKEVRASGVDLGIALTAKTSLLLQTWERLNYKQSPKHVLFTPEQQQHEPIITVHEGLNHLLLPRLQLRTLYRLIFFNKRVHEIVDNKYFWRKLIERDVGVVPDFIANTLSQLRLYYLKKMNFNVPLTIYGLDDQDEVFEQEHNVVFSNENVIIYNNNTLLNLITNKLSRLDLIGRSIKATIRQDEEEYLLSTDGRLYDYEGNEIKLRKLQVFDNIADIYYDRVLTKSGIVYLTIEGGEKAVEVMVGEPIVSLDYRLLSKTGKYYKFKKIGHHEVNELVPDGELDLTKYRWEPISKQYPLYIESDGNVSDEKMPPTMYFGVYTALWKYYMVSVYQIEIDRRTHYQFRGFKH